MVCDFLVILIFGCNLSSEMLLSSSITSHEVFKLAHTWCVFLVLFPCFFFSFSLIPCIFPFSFSFFTTLVVSKDLGCICLCLANPDFH